MTTETRIIQYVHAITKGVVILTDKHAAAIIDIIKTAQAQHAVAKLSCYNMQRGTYQFIQAITTTDARVKEKILQALNIPPVMELYQYECFNSNGEFEGFIYSANPAIF